MPQTINKRISAAVAALLLTVAAVALAACGSSSNGSTTSTVATTTGSTTSSGPTSTTPPAKATTTTGSTTNKPTTTTGSTPSKTTTTTGPAAKAVQPPSGAASALRACLQQNGVNLSEQATSAQAKARLQAALKKCIATVPGNSTAKPNSSTAKTLAKFEACLRQNGINAGGVNTNSPAYKAALAKCRSILTPAGAGHIPGLPAGSSPGSLAGAGVPTG